MTPSVTPSALPSLLVHRAADWQARLQAPDCTAEDREAFERWCAADPAHIDAWLDLATLHAQAAGLREDPAIADAARPARRAAVHARQRHWRNGLSLAAAAALVLVAGLAGWLHELRSPAIAHYATPIGQQQVVMLADGSRVLLDTDSAIRAEIAGAHRVLHVERGRVDITVAADTRPFEVHAGRGRLRDIGTRFQVAHAAGQVRVAVLEGAVGVRLADAGPGETPLSPGQQLDYGPEGPLQAVEPADLDAADSWTRGELVYANRRLDEVLAELNRYSTVKLRLADPAIGAERISGVFHAGDADAVLAALGAGWGLIAQETADGEIVLSRGAH